jgi:hypothetical protein
MTDPALPMVGSALPPTVEKMKSLNDPEDTVLSDARNGFRSV